VWLANLRGVAPYGRQHIDLTDVMADFWRFSFHEHGAYDLPAIIDHMAEVTGGEQQARGGGGGPGADEEQMPRQVLLIGCSLVVIFCIHVFVSHLIWRLLLADFGFFGLLFSRCFSQPSTSGA